MLRRFWISSIATLLLALPVASGWSAERGPTRAAAAALASDAGRVIVKYRATAALGRAQAAGATAAGAQHASTLGARTGLALSDGRALGARMQVLTGRGLGAEALAARLARDPDVEWAVPDRRRRAQMVPNDPLFAAGQVDPLPPQGQWALRSPAGPHDAATGMQRAWDTTLGSGVVVAVLDTGVRTEHPDLAGRFLAGYNMISPDGAGNGNASGKCITGNGACRSASAADPGDWVSQADLSAYPALFDASCLGDSSWHGTEVAGLLGASTDNGIGVAGVAPAASLLPVRVLGKCGGYDSDIIDGIRWAAGLSVTGVPANPHPARVINLSLGGTGPCGAAYQAAIDEVITRKQAVVVVAAGNEGDAVGAPANCSGVIAVGGLRHTGTKVGYSNLGPEVALSAPAGNCVNDSGACLYPLLTTRNDGTTTPGNSTYSDAYAATLGTSFSSPLVAGTAALMLSVRPALTSAQVRATLRSSARAFPSTGAATGVAACRAPDSVLQDSECYCTTSTCGAGMLDAAAAVAAVGSVMPQIVATPSPVTVGARVQLDGRGSQVGSGRSVASYLWEIVSGGSLAHFTSATNGATATLDTGATGTLGLRLTVRDDLGNQAYALQSLVIADSGLTAVISASEASPTVGDTVTLSAAGSLADSGRSIVAYQWTLVDGSANASFSGGTQSASASLQASAPGSVTVQLTVTDSEGLQASSTWTATVAAAGSGGSGGGAASLGAALGLGLAALALPRRRRARS